MKCLDSYALVEIKERNPKFSYLLSEDTVITSLTLAEFIGLIYKESGNETAHVWLKRLSPMSRDVPLDVFVDAIKYRIDHHKENLSVFDCVGYIFSVKNKIKFVTGDKAFEKRPSVEFIKK
jgi:hypothetical protein